ncbi:class I adenylate-forming enzyme family protein [Sporichthya polymorpha]|uniref:class I adenylate-forming enzyme family protein n=1 Tax=Sporichthya polymorpha TaxID=35751 RepID=UPI000373EB91|nr:class I adenylate-forming enzyme family protein [Sporichthya polymorpha]
MTFEMLLDMAREACPQRQAVGSRNADRMSYADLARRAAGGATLIRDSDASHVAFLGVGSPVFPALVFASAHAGIPIAPLNYRLPAEQINDLLAQLGRPYVVADPEFLDVVRSAEVAGVISTGEWSAAAAVADEVAPSAVDPDSPAVLLFTSGTTSTPKAVVLRHGHLVSYVLQTVEFLGAEEDDCALISVPPYHIAGVGAVLTNVYSGRRFHYLPNFDPAEWLRTVREEAVTNTMLVPTMLARVVDRLGEDQARVPSLRAIAYGGARMPRTVLERALRAFPDVGFTNAYGLTETASTIAVLGPEDHRAAVESEDPTVQARLGSVGRPVPGIEVEIRSPDGAALPAGQPGELWVRGPQVSGEYAGSGSVLDENGWFPTKDAAVADVDGYLHVLGRVDDTIIRGGENIGPAEIEEVLRLHPAVADVAVFGAPDDEWGQRTVAAVVQRAGAELTAHDLRAWAKERLRSSRTPDDVVFLAELPYTPTGKLLRRQLADEFASVTR